MSRGLRRYLIGSVAMLSLAACGRGYVSFEERPAWRAEAEATCLKSGAVKISDAVKQIDPINGPGMCGAEFPLKVAALGQGNSAMGYALRYGDDPRPPGGIPNASQPRWPIAQPQYAPPQQNYQPRYEPQVLRAPAGSQPTPGEPMTIAPSGQRPSYAQPSNARAPLPQSQTFEMDDEDDIPDDAELPQRPSGPATRPAYNAPPAPSPRVPRIPQLGPPRGLYTGAAGPAIITPTATLACPIVSALDQWVAGAIQPAAQRWFGQPVVEIKQISAYSCRGMNGQAGAHISEHAFGNALDVAAFVLADGRKVTVKNSWNGTPEEQGFLHDVQGAACQTFNTVLAPGSNKYHYDHIHVDLMRRASGRRICQPGAIDGEVVAARAANRLARRGGDPGTTGSIGGAAKPKFEPKYAIPGEDDLFDDEDDEVAPPSAVTHQRVQHKTGKQNQSNVPIRLE